MKRFRDARDKGCAYLLAQQHPDGSFGDPQKGVTDYYKVPAAFQVCGETNAANRLCAWIRANGMTPDGDFGPRPGGAEDYAYIYPNAWIVVGAHRLGQFDLSQMGMDFLMGFWDSQSGGFYSSATERNADTKQDLMVVSFCGLAAVYTGRLDVARAAGRWATTVMEEQPNYPRQMFTCFSRAKGLYTEPDPEDELRYVVNADATRDQQFFQPGVAGGFLARLYQATGEEQWLALAKEYMRFAEGASDYLFRIVRAGKVGWASSVLYPLTGEQKYRDMAIRIGDNLIALQSEQGFWSTVGGTEPDNASTAERVVWMDETYQAVGGE